MQTLLSHSNNKLTQKLDLVHFLIYVHLMIKLQSFLHFLIFVQRPSDRFCCVVVYYPLLLYDKFTTTANGKTTTTMTMIFTGAVILWINIMAMYNIVISYCSFSFSCEFKIRNEEKKSNTQGPMEIYIRLKFTEIYFK